MNKKLLSILIVLVFWCCNSVAAPTDTTGTTGTTGTVSIMICYTSGIPYCRVAMNGIPNMAACSISGLHYTFDATSLEGKNIFSMILAAQLSKQTITIAGKGTCSLIDGSEDLRSVYIKTAP